MVEIRGGFRKGFRVDALSGGQKLRVVYFGIGKPFCVGFWVKTRRGGVRRSFGRRRTGM